MSRYDTSKTTTPKDVSKEASEAATEIGQAAAAVSALASGSGSVAEVKKEVVEALGASGEVVAAVADLVVDEVKALAEKGMRFFKNKLGYTIHDPEQDKVFSPAKVTPAEATQWVEDRLKEGTIVEMSAEEAADAARGPLLRDELS